MNVSLSGQVFQFPRQCICCGEAPDTELYVSATQSRGKKTSTHRWGFPCCNACLTHSQVIQKANTFPTFLIILGFIACLFGISLLAANPLLALPLIISSIFFLVYSFRLSRKRLQQARTSKREECAADNPYSLVRYFGWDKNIHTFSIKPERYAFAFMRANRQKLVNVPPDIFRLLNDQTPAPTPPVQPPIVSPKPQRLKAQASAPTPPAQPSIVSIEPQQVRLSPTSSAQHTGTAEQRLLRLADLRDKGIITPEEYETQRRQIINGV
jgi:hypothetical protein